MTSEEKNNARTGSLVLETKTRLRWKLDREVHMKSFVSNVLVS